MMIAMPHRAGALALALLILAAHPAQAQAVAARVEAPAGYAPLQAPCVVQTDGTCAPVRAATPLPVDAVLARIEPQDWANSAIARDLRAYPSAEIQVAGLAGGDLLTCSRSLNGTNYIEFSAIYDMNGEGPHAAITVDGIYSVRGGGFLRCPRTGAASMPTVTIRAGQ